MTKQEIIEKIIDIDNAIEYVKRNKALYYYNKDKVHFKQIEFHKNPHKNDTGILLPVFLLSKII